MDLHVARDGEETVHQVCTEKSYRYNCSLKLVSKGVYKVIGGDISRKTYAICILKFIVLRFLLVI